MKIKPRHLAQASVIAALYVVLTYFQNMLLPGSATWAVQLRLSEMLAVLAFFTPAAASGLAIGCLIFNLTYAGALPLDFLAGTAASYLAGKLMWKSRRIRLLGLPLPGLLMPALTNALLVGGELALYIGGGFFYNAAFVSLGEAIVLLLPGSVLYRAMEKRHLGHRLFS